MTSPRLEYHRTYYQKNKDKIKSKQRDYRLAHRDKLNEYLHDYYRKNKDKMYKINRLWTKRNIGRVRLFKQRYKQRHWVKYRKGESNRAKKLRLELLDILGGPKCIRCGYEQDWRALNFDHIRDDGAEDRLIHGHWTSFYSFYISNPEIARANLQVLCCNCNQIKKYDLMGFSKDGK